jgi:hypothetical protein
MKTTITSSKPFLVPITVIILLLGIAEPSQARDGWQEAMLFSPSEDQLELEKRGRVMIYDGLKDTQIAEAMDSQFDRIQSMMFIRTIVTDSEGEPLRDKESDTVVVVDDGC